MIKEYPLKLRQVCLFIITIMPVLKLFWYPSIVCANAQEDAWIATLFSGILDILSITLILLVCHNTEKDIYTFLEDGFGKIGSKIILFLYLIYFLIKVTLPLIEQKGYVKLTLYEMMPNIISFTPFFIASVYLCMQRVRTLGRCSDMLWIFTLLGLIIVISLTIPHADYESIKPVGARGLSSIANAIYSGATWFGDSVYIMMLIGKFNYHKKSIKKIIASYSVSLIMLTFLIISFYGVFTYIAHRQSFALTDFSKYFGVINNLGRFDYMGIFLLLVSSAFSTIIPIYFATEIVQKIFGFNKKTIPALIINSILFIILTFFDEYFLSIKTFIMTIASSYLLLVPLISPLILLIVKAKQRKEKKHAIKQA